MRLNYKRLGDYIEPCNEKNDGNVIKKLQGISNRKYFQKAKTNTIGIDLSKYRVVRTGQFAFNRATTRNGDKISIALRHSKDCIVSPSYRIFKSKDENILNSEYLMMWFKRPDFDRYARFKSHGSAHEFFDWAEMQEVDLPIPTIEKQREIVKEYNTIVNRITLNETLNQKLEETAQALYKHWFVDFEFPNLYGRPYKSSGGLMVFNEELDLEIPEGWEVNYLGDLVESFSKTHDFVKDELIFFNTSDILEGEFLHKNYSEVFKMPGQAKKRIKKNDILYSEIRPKNKRFALVRINADDYVVSTKLMVLRRISEKLSVYRLYHFLTADNFIKVLQQSAEGRSGTFPQITFELDIEKKSVLIANDKTEKMWNAFLTNFYLQSYSRKDENKILIELKNLILSKMSKVETETALV
jgi:type I restriction enzyme S subunit